MLLPIGIGLALAIKGINVDAIIQGILVVGVTVYGNQVFKQIGKTE
ncbi:MAG: phage holin family protein [Clostridium sp.]|nr:phage holin family protein [Clostridium sp.]